MFQIERSLLSPLREVYQLIPRMPRFVVAGERDLSLVDPASGQTRALPGDKIGNGKVCADFRFLAVVDSGSSVQLFDFYPPPALLKRNASTDAAAAESAAEAEILRRRAVDEIESFSAVPELPPADSDDENSDADQFDEFEAFPSMSLDRD